MRRCGTPRAFDFEAKDHVDLGEALGMLDFAAAAKLSGARFTFLRGDLARLHRALAQFMLDTHTQEHGYTECYTPYIVNAATLVGTRSCRSSRTTCSRSARAVRKATGDPLYLIPTSEITLTNFVRDEILAARRAADQVDGAHAVLPLGSRQLRQGHARHDPPAPVRQGRDGAGRASRASPTQALEELTGHAEAILQKLGLPYRVMALCTGDMGFGAAKTYDLEVWLPAQDTYREISLVLELRGVPGAAHAGALPQRAGQARAGAHAERLRPRRRPHAGRGAGELPARRRLDRHPRVLSART